MHAFKGSFFLALPRPSLRRDPHVLQGSTDVPISASMEWSHIAFRRHKDGPPCAACACGTRALVSSRSALHALLPGAKQRMTPCCNANTGRRRENAYDLATEPSPPDGEDERGPAPFQSRRSISPFDASDFPPPPSAAGSRRNQSQHLAGTSGYRDLPLGDEQTTAMAEAAYGDGALKPWVAPYPTPAFPTSEKDEEEERLLLRRRLEESDRASSPGMRLASSAYDGTLVASVGSDGEQFCWLDDYYSDPDTLPDGRRLRPRTRSTLTAAAAASGPPGWGLSSEAGNGRDQAGRSPPTAAGPGNGRGPRAGPAAEARPGSSGAAGGIFGGASKYAVAGVFMLGIGAGVSVDTALNVAPSNVASREVIDRQTPNPDICLANGMSAMVLDQRLFISFNPFNVYVSQAEVKPGCVLRQSNWGVLESRGLVTPEEVRDCKRNMNTFGFVGDLRQAPELSCVYHSESAENLFLEDPAKATLGDGFQPRDFRNQ